VDRGFPDYLEIDDATVSFGFFVNVRLWLDPVMGRVSQSARFALSSGHAKSDVCFSLDDVGLTLNSGRKRASKITPTHDPKRAFNAARSDKFLPSMPDSRHVP
jgi:hypothetical protein